jgi:hypothetical protein
VLDESGIEGEEKKDEREGWVGRRVTTKNGKPRDLYANGGELVGTTLSSSPGPIMHDCTAGSAAGGVALAAFGSLHADGCGEP